MFDISDPEMMAAIQETSYLANLGNRGTGPAPKAQPTPVQPSIPAELMQAYNVSTPHIKLFLDGTRIGEMFDRSFVLTPAELAKILKIFTSAYERAAAEELKELRRIALGNTEMREVQDEGSPADAQNVRSLPGPERVEITYTDAEGREALPRLRPPGSENKVSGVQSPEAGSGVAASDTRPEPSRSLAGTGRTSTNVLHDNGTLTTPTAKGRGVPTSRQG